MVKSTIQRIFIGLFFILAACTGDRSKTPADAEAPAVNASKEELLALEEEFLVKEFALDTGYLATQLDSTFISISADHIANRQQELDGIYKNISAMRQANIFLDSLKLEDAVVNVFGETAIVLFTVHTYKKDNGRPVEKRTIFYDVWVKRKGNWKLAASQGTVKE